MSIRTVNALSPDVYSGDAKMSYGRKGHITGSVNVHYEDLLVSEVIDGAVRRSRDLLGHRARPAGAKVFTGGSRRTRSDRAADPSSPLPALSAPSGCKPI